MLKLDMTAEFKVQMMTSFASRHQSLMPIQAHFISTLQPININKNIVTIPFQQTDSRTYSRDIRSYVIFI